MKLLSLLHRWTGGLVGLVLAVVGLSGAILVWEEQWIALPHSNEPVVQEVASLARIVDAAGPELSRITFAQEGMSLHQLVFNDGSGAYLSQAGHIVDRWRTQWERPELWLFDLHHHLFAGETGEWVTGIAGLIGLMFLVTGLILWWRSRRAFRLRLLPRGWTPGPIVAHHRDIGAMASPLLLVSLVTGVLMLFAPLRATLLGAEERPRVATGVRVDPSPAALLAAAARRFPAAELRRLTFPTNPAAPLTVRLRQPFEWTPNGRTQLGVEPGGALWVEDAAQANRAARTPEKAYPLHSAKVGGLMFKLAMTLSGVALAMLGSLTTWSFWRRRIARAASRRRPGRAPGPVPIASGS
jgi:uncharacterized iron-regulated membrane protein